MTGAIDTADGTGAVKAAAPELRTVTPYDIVECLDKGIKDFRAAPKYGLFFGLAYAVAGWLIAALLFQFELPFLAYPLATGFALIAPFAATGLYHVSRCLERGEPLSWDGVLGSVRAVSGKEMVWMAVVAVFSLIIWMDIAAFLFFAFMGFGGGNSGDLVKDILTTPTGWVFLAIGNVIGAILAACVFSYSAVSYPMLYDREVDFVTAMLTSVKTCIKNPSGMITWAIIIAVHLALALATFLVGLVLALPVLGHTTWHVYRKAVGPPAT